jgi:penicillin-binding protein 2
MIKTKHHIWRVSLVGIITLILSLVMGVRLARLQLSASSRSGSTLYGNIRTKNYKVETPAMRGMIFDRYGRPLISNTVIYNIIFDYNLWDKEKQHEVLLKLRDVCSKHGVSYADSLPLSLTSPEFTDGWANHENKSLANFIEARKWSLDISAQDLFDKMCKFYKIPEELDYKDARYLIGIRYEMEKASFSSVNGFTFCKNIDIGLVVEINELSGQLPGVLTQCSYTRNYETKYAAHILGRVGAIFSDEYQELAKQGYQMDDLVGKDGAEKAFEQYLRGIEGYTTYKIDINDSGRIVDIIEKKEPRAGGNVILTMDLKLQAAVEDALASHINLMVAEGFEDPNKPQDVGGGAAVVLDVNTGDVLAIASYPSYDITRFSELYNELLNDELKPMFNRAISGVYSPGSVFKMVTSVAGLELGIITPSSSIPCTGIYRYYKDYTPFCWIYKYGFTHGSETIVTALRDSCNIFFFDVGRQVGIENLSRYARLFGLGDYTGIEIPGESKGFAASPEAKKALEKKPWVDGDTLQASIGQSSNLFTPIQLANYIATLANGGTRYECHLLKYVTGHNFSEIEYATQSVIAGRVEMSGTTFATVMEGMSEVTENGTASDVFKNYSIHVGGKTGSAQVSKGSSNSIFAAFAPFEDPEIAVVVVVEHGGSGNRIAPIARKIFDVYFNLDKELSQKNQENSLAN